MRGNLGDLRGFFLVAATKFDCCIDFSRTDRSAVLTLLSGADKRVASSRIKHLTKLRRRLYNELVEQRMHDMHTIDYNLSLLKPLGIHTVTPPVELNLPPAASEHAAAIRRQARINEAFIVLHPGSARPEKFWEPDRWANIISHAITHLDCHAILTGGTSAQEKAHLAEIESRLPPPQSSPCSIVDLSGKVDLLTLAALIAQARLIITVDTAPMHLAAAMRIPQVVLFGPTNPYHWYPRDSPALILQGDSPLPVRKFVPKQPRLPMKLISTQAVIDAMNALLSAPAAQAL
jgi:ADP-heptose:LPS heptosyltransferase